MIVGHRQDARLGRARLLEQQVEDEGLVLGVEIARRLIGDHKLGTRHQRPADGDTLLLALAQAPGCRSSLSASPQALARASARARTSASSDSADVIR